MQLNKIDQQFQFFPNLNMFLLYVEHKRRKLLWQLIWHFLKNNKVYLADSTVACCSVCDTDSLMSLLQAYTSIIFVVKTLVQVVKNFWDLWEMVITIRLSLRIQGASAKLTFPRSTPCEMMLKLTIIVSSAPEMSFVKKHLKFLHISFRLRPYLRFLPSTAESPDFWKW